MNKRAFTLVEILIAMTIIGVVAVLTIPALYTAYQKKVLTTQLQRAYAEISQAAKAVMLDEGEVDDFKSTEAIENLTFLGKYLVITESDKGFVDTYGYFNDKHTAHDLKAEVARQYGSWGGPKLSEDDYKCGITKAGAAICLNKYSRGVLDVNGIKGPNLVGRDAFSIGFNADGTVSTKYSTSLASIIHNDWDIDKPNKLDNDNNNNSNDNNNNNNNNNNNHHKI